MKRIAMKYIFSRNIVTTQLQHKTKLGWPHNWVEPATTPPPAAHHHHPTQIFKAPRKLNIFENGRRPQFFPNGRWPLFFSRKPRKLVFGMQHCFNPTRWNIKTTMIFERWKKISMLWSLYYIISYWSALVYNKVAIMLLLYLWNFLSLTIGFSLS